MGTIKDLKYKVVKNFLTSEEQLLLSTFTQIRHRHNTSAFCLFNNNGDTGYYGDAIMESLLVEKQKKMEEYTGLKLYPTYSYWRLYTYGSNLLKHKDRHSCEISVSVCIDNDGPKWPIFIEGKAIDLEPGDAVIYLGCELKHWREDFTGDWQSQVFLHYVDQEGDYADLKLDKRLMLADPPGVEIEINEH
jgi:hypothetical protein